MIQLEKLTTLTQALALREREHIALVGGGGKTSLLFALASELQGLNRKVITSTTTKVWYREALKADSVWMTDCGESWQEGVRKDLAEGKSVFLGLKRLESGKVAGVDPSLLNAFYQEEELSYLLVESDGSAGHPVKAPSRNEPVVPGSATMVLAVMGVEVLGSPFSPSLVFREDAFERVTGITAGEIITSLPLSRLFIHPDGLFKSAPGGARRVVLMNKADLAHDSEQVHELTRLVLTEPGTHVERVVVGSVRTGEWEVYVNQGLEVQGPASGGQRPIGPAEP